MQTSDGGTVTAESEGEDKGARFLVRLPLADADAEALPLPEAQRVERPSRQAFRGMRVLVVDDDTDTRQLTTEILESYAAEVAAADSAASAFDRAREQRIDVLITDIGLPGEDGYSLLRRLCGLPGGADITAIALTAYATQQDSRRAAEAGFQRHLSKPIEPLYLVAVLAELVERNEPADLPAAQMDTHSAPPS